MPDNGMSLLHKYLEDNYKSKEEKLLKLDKETITSFQDNIAIPALTKIQEKLSEYEFNKISIQKHSIIVKIRIAREEYRLVYKIEIDNNYGKVRLHSDIEVKTSFRTSVSHPHWKEKTFPLSEIDTINEEVIIRHFTDTLMSVPEKIKETLNTPKAMELLPNDYL